MIPELAELAIPTSGMSPRSASTDGGQDEGGVAAAAIEAPDAGTSAGAAEAAGAGLAEARGATTGADLDLAGASFGDWTTTVGKVTADCANALPDDNNATRAAKLELLLARVIYSRPPI